MTTDPDPVTPADRDHYDEMAAADAHYEQLEADNVDLIGRLEELQAVIEEGNRRWKAAVEAAKPGRRGEPLRPSMVHRPRLVGESQEDYDLREQM